MTESVVPPCKPKLSRATRQQIRRATAMASSASYGIGGLPRSKKVKPITLRLPPGKR